MIEIVSPGDKSGRRATEDFIDKVETMLRSGVHLLIVDLLPPGAFDPHGLPALLGERFGNEDAPDFSKDEPLSLAAFLAGERIAGRPLVEGFIEPTTVGATLIDMPLFLSPERYVLTPLEETYQRAWEAVPRVWREALESTSEK